MQQEAPSMMQASKMLSKALPIMAQPNQNQYMSLQSMSDHPMAQDREVKMEYKALEKSRRKKKQDTASKNKF